MELANKKILYIGLDYYRFPVAISSELENLGAKVTFFPIKRRTLLSSILFRLNKKYFNIYLRKYHLRFLTTISSASFDYVFIIHSHFLSREILIEYKKCYKSAKFILYEWDSLKTHSYLHLIDLFDTIYTFDKEDAQRLDIKYLPLFYTIDFSKIKLDKISNKKDILFIGTFNNKTRYDWLKEFILFVNRNKLILNHYLWIRWTRYIRLIYEERIVLNIKYLKFRNISFPKYLELFKAHNFILDIPNNPQSGLTMRVLETLGSGRKLITTNINIKNELFYNSDNIFVLTEDNWDELLEFINENKENNKKNNERIDDFSLANWLKQIFGTSG